MRKIFIIIVFMFMTFTLVWAESYRTMNDNCIKRVSDLAVIPPTKENSDYVKYLEDVKNGAEVKPYDYVVEEARQQTEKDKNKEKIDIETMIQNKIKEQTIAILKQEGKLDENGHIKK